MENAVFNDHQYFVLAQGAQSEVYTSPNCPAFVVKVAKQGCSLSQEAGFLQMMNGVAGFPKIFEFGTKQFAHSSCQRDYIVMEKLVMSLSELMQMRNCQLSVFTIRSILCELVDLLKELHFRDVVHCDIKPENVMFGGQLKRASVHLIDFGLANTLDNSSRQDTFAGSMLFSSIRKMASGVASFYSDLEEAMTLGLWLCLKGRIPWQLSQQTYKQINQQSDLTNQQKVTTIFQLIKCKKQHYFNNLSLTASPGASKLFHKILFILKDLQQLYLPASDTRFDWNIYDQIKCILNQ